MTTPQQLLNLERQFWCLSQGLGVNESNGIGANSEGHLLIDKSKMAE